jgi:putative ABC transport system permease protein
VSPLGVLFTALRALRRNKVRSGLTMLGIAIGILAVIAMVALGRGASTMIYTQINAAGKNIILVLPEAVRVRGFSMGLGTSTTLSPGDAAAIARDVLSVLSVAPMIRAREQLVFGSRNWIPLAILGTTPEFLEIREWPVEEGVSLSALDLASHARVCVLGQTVADNLFQGASPVGETVRIRNMPFKVIGLLSRKGLNPMGLDQDDILVTPWTTTKTLIQGSAFDSIDQILVSAVSQSRMPEAALEIRELLRQRHHLAPEEEDNFGVLTMTEMAEVLTRTSKLMTTLLGIVASISLLVGGIGIMNVMLVSVAQRTHEIGLRLAVGARRRDILVQFLTEAGVLSVVAGMAGTLAGILAAVVLSETTHWPVFVSPGSVSVAFLFSAAVGMFFGLYPALRASRLDPIDALRYE